MGVLSPIHPGRTGTQRPGPVPPRREETEGMDHMLTEGELRRRRRELHALAGKAEAEPQGKERIRYGLDGPQGRQLYESCSDQELLELLRERAGALGRSPRPERSPLDLPDLSAGPIQELAQCPPGRRSEPLRRPVRQASGAGPGRGAGEPEALGSGA